MIEGLVVDPDWLAARLHDPAIRVIDASWYLPAAARDARAEYVAAHIPGAVFLDLSSDLADLTAPVRNTIASPEALALAFGRAGIGNRHHVVIYDRLSGFSAGRVWWSLRYIGHERVSLLDGGFVRWTALGHPVSRETPEPTPERLLARPQPRWLAHKEQLLDSLGRGGPQIVDARSATRFRGEGEEHARHLGHIPGSFNVPYDANLRGDPPRLRPLAELRELYERAGVRFDRPVVTSCGSGVTAALDAFVLTLLGHPEVAVYDGSWAEWGNTDDTPIETGAPARNRVSP